MPELSLEHASFLAEHLSPHASVWRKLGTALKFRQQDLDNIQGCLPLMNESPYSYMQRLVEEWLEGKYPHTAPPTLADLLKALNSHTVGLGTLATQIRDSPLPQHDQSVDAKVFETASVSDRGNVILSQSEGPDQLDQLKESLASIYLAQPEVPQDSWPPISNKTYINLALVKQQAINYGEEYARLTIRGDMDDILHHKEKIEYEDIFDGLGSGSLLLIEGRPGSGKTTFVHKITRDWAASEVQGPMRLVLLVSLRVLNNWEKPVTLEDILKLFDFHENENLLKDKKGKGVCFIFDGLDEFSPLEGENSIIHKIIYKTCLPQSIVIVASRPAALVNLRQRAVRIIEIIGFPKDQIFEYVKNYPSFNTSKAKQLKSYLSSHPNVLHMCYLPIHAAMVAFLFEVMGKVPHTETEIYTHFTRFTLMRSLSKYKGQGALENMDTSKLSGEEKELFDTICEFALEKTILKKQVLDQDEMKLRLQGKSRKDITLGLVTIDRTAGLYGFKNIYTFLHLTYQEYLAAYHISTLSDEDQHKLIKQHGDKDHMQVVWKFYCGLANFEGREYKVKALANRKSKIVLSDIQCAYESQQKVVCDCFMKEMDAQITLKGEYLTTSDFTALGYLLANSSIPISLSLINCDMNNEAVSAIRKETKEKTLCLRALSCESSNIDLESLVELLSQQHSLEYLKIYSYASISYCFLMDWSQQYSVELYRYDFSNIIGTSLANLKELSLINVLIDEIILDNVLQFCKELSFLAIINDSNTADLYLYTGEYLIEHLFKGISECKKLERVTFTTHTINYPPIWLTIELTRIGTDFDFKMLKDDEYFTNICIQGVRGNYLQTIGLKSDDMSENSYLDYWPPRPKLLAIQGELIACYGHSNNILMPDFSALETLVLEDITADIENASLFSEKLSHCVILQEVEITLEEYDAVPEFLTILSGLRSCSNLQKFVLTNIYIKIDDTCILASCLQHWPKLQELHLRGCGIEGERAKAIAENVKNCPELAEVDLSDITYDPEGITTMISDLKNCPNLQRLVLNNKYISTDVSVLGSCHQYWPKLQELHLRGCGIEEGAKAIADNIKYLPELAELDLSDIKYNPSLPDGIATIILGLKNCPNLQKLVLNNRHISTDNTHVLASCLQHWPKLQELHLRGCGIEEEGAKVIADNIKYCPELIVINLMSEIQNNEEATFVRHKKHFSNDISDETLKMIKSSLQSHKDVTDDKSINQPHDKVTNQSHHQIPESQQPQDKADSKSSHQNNVSSICNKGGKHGRKKLRKTDGEPSPSKRPKLSRSKHKRV